MAIKNFRHKGLEDYFYDGTTRGINPRHTKKLDSRLDRLDASTSPGDMGLPGYRLHQLKPKSAGRWAIDVSGAWRLTFEFDGENAVAIDYQQYH